MPATLTSVPICANADLAQQPAHIYRPCEKIMAEIAFFTSHSLWLEKNHISGCLLYSGKFRPVRINFCWRELFPESSVAKQWQWFRGTSFFIKINNNVFIWFNMTNKGYCSWHKILSVLLFKQVSFPGVYPHSSAYAWHLLHQVYLPK